MLNVKMKLGCKALVGALAAAILSVLPAHAVSISPGDIVSEAFPLAPSSTIDFDFEPVEPLQVVSVTTSGTGIANGDLNTVLFGINGVATPFSMFTENMGTAGANGGLPGFFATEPFTVSFATPDTEENVVLTFTLITEDVPRITPVPLPASGMMLGGVLLLALGGVAVRRRYRG